MRRQLYGSVDCLVIGRPFASKEPYLDQRTNRIGVRKKGSDLQQVEFEDGRFVRIVLQKRAVHYWIFCDRAV